MNEVFLIYGLAILSSGFLGHWLVRPFVTHLKKYASDIAMSDDDVEDEEIGGLKPRYPKLSSWLGIIERTIYTSSWLLGPLASSFIVVWFGTKSAVFWGEWKKATQEARAKFTISMIGSGLSLLIAVGFALLAQYAVANWL